MILSKLLASFGLFTSWDILVLTVLVVVVFLYGLTSGRQRIVCLIIATYFSYIILQAIPWQHLGFLGIKTAPSATAQVFVFLGLILAILFLLPQSSLGLSLKSGGKRKKARVKLLIFSILWVGLLVSLILSFLSSQVLGQLNLKTLSIFSGGLSQFIWLILPIAALLIFRIRKLDR